MENNKTLSIGQSVNNIQSLGIDSDFRQNDVKAAAFTLAEVLIALGIIGIVAAMTIPTLVQNYKRKQASVKIKHFYSLMTQAIQLSEVENGSALYWTKEAMAYNEDGTIDSNTNRALALTFYNTYLKNYIKTSKIIESTGYTSYVYLNDGSAFRFHNGSCTDIWYYVNGYNTNPTDGKDRFAFLICPSTNNSSYHKFNPKRAFGSYTQSGLTTREKALAKCKSSGIYCTVLLEIYDNFEFKEDYPYKL